MNGKREQNALLRKVSLPKPYYFNFITRDAHKYPGPGQTIMAFPYALRVRDQLVFVLVGDVQQEQLVALVRVQHVVPAGHDVALLLLLENPLPHYLLVVRFDRHMGLNRVLPDLYPDVIVRVWSCVAGQGLVVCVRIVGLLGAAEIHSDASVGL